MSAHPPDTRPGLSDRDLALLERFSALIGAGARVSVTDPRVTKAIVWLLVAVGGITITVGTWLISESVSQGRLMERVVTILESHQRRIDKLEDRTP